MSRISHKIAVGIEAVACLVGAALQGFLILAGLFAGAYIASGLFGM